MKLLLLIVSFFIVTGCTSNEKEVVKEEPIEKTTKELVHIKAEKINSRNFILLITNNNNIPIDLSVNYAFYNKAGEDVFNRYRELENIKPNDFEIINIILPQPVEDIYMIYEVYESNNEIPKSNRVEYSHKRYKNDITLKLENKSIEPVFSKVYTIFYKNGKIIEYQKSIEVIFPFELELVRIRPEINNNYDRYDIFIN